MSEDKKPSATSFEAELEQLEQVVSQLEAGEKPLDESLALYERGVAALKRCHGILDQAEKRIRALVKTSAGEPTLRDTDAPPPADEEKRAARKKSPAPFDAGATTRQNPQPSDTEAGRASPAVQIKRTGETPVPPPTEGGGNLFGTE